jgi:putative oxidoreductase
MIALAAARTRIHSLFSRIESLVPLSLIQLAARLAVAGIFFKSGLTKVDGDWNVTPLTVVLFRDEYKVPVIPPEIAAHMGTFFELTMPILLVVGFLTRFATLPLLGMTAVIGLFIYPAGWDTHLSWAVMLILILSRGPGMLSLDAALGIEPRRW